MALTVQVVSPERILWTGEADMVTARTIEGGDISLAYHALENATGRLAARLRALGAVPGDRIVAQVEKSVEAVILYLAALRAGLVFVPLNTGYTAEELRHFVSDAAPCLLVCSPANLTALTPIAAAHGVARLSAGDGKPEEPEPDVPPLRVANPVSLGVEDLDGGHHEYLVRGSKGAFGGGRAVKVGHGVGGADGDQ